MGDARRNEIFASFIVKNFPKAKTVLCVADGKGELAEMLAKKGKRVRVIEQEPRFSGRAHKKLSYTKGTFSSNTEVAEDLVVGMHPDEATEAIVKAAKRSSKSYAIVPCCFMLENGKKPATSTATGWNNYLMSLWPGSLSTQLKGMNGKNIVVYRRA